MTAPAQASGASAPRQPGRLSRALIRMLMKRVRIVEAEPIGERFRLITLESLQFRGLHWTPGQKVQIAMGSAFVARTFTPIEWDAKAGRTRILGYAHGEGPGSAWVRGVRSGDECDVFGPRASLDVRHAGSACVVLGDETSIGIAYALGRPSADLSAPHLLEVNASAEARDALARLSVEAEVFQRTEKDAHLEGIERRLPPLAASGATFVLTGKALSIQRLRRALKVLGVPASRLATKPYWAPGKTGLD